MHGDTGQLAAAWRARFDAVVLAWTLHHVANPTETLCQVGHMLKPDGKVLNGEWAVEQGQERGDCLKFTAREIQQMVQEVGFQDTDVEWIEPYLVLVMGRK